MQASEMRTCLCCCVGEVVSSFYCGIRNLGLNLTSPTIPTEIIGMKLERLMAGLCIVKLNQTIFQCYMYHIPVLDILQAALGEDHCPHSIVMLPASRPLDWNFPIPICALIIIDEPLLILTYPCWLAVCHAKWIHPDHLFSEVHWLGVSCCHGIYGYVIGVLVLHEESVGSCGHLLRSSNLGLDHNCQQLVASNVHDRN
jgi:hypothetical protein